MDEPGQFALSISHDHRAARTHSAGPSDQRLIPALREWRRSRRLRAGLARRSLPLSLGEAGVRFDAGPTAPPDEREVCASTQSLDAPHSHSSRRSIAGSPPWQPKRVSEARGFNTLAWRESSARPPLSVSVGSDGVAIEELGDPARDGFRALDLQEVTDALHGQVLDLREPRAQQGRAIDEQPLALGAQH
jgi:hypothetical protein